MQENTMRTLNADRKGSLGGLRRVLVVLAAVVGMGVTLVGTAPAASAWQYDASAGRPGAVTATAQVNVARLNVGGVQRITLFGNTGPTVSRSAGSAGAQDVSILYSVQRWTGSQWVQVTRQFNAVRIGSAVQRVTLPALYVIPTSGVGYYRVVEVFQWNVAGTSQVLGNTTIVPNYASDHACLYRPCATSPGYVWAG